MSSRLGNAETLGTAPDWSNPISDAEISGIGRINSAITRFMRSEGSTLVAALILTLGRWYVMGDVVRDHDNLAGTDTYWHVILVDEAL